MKGDFTRSTVDLKKHYSSVRMQQGRVQLDADWNEQTEIELHHSRTTNFDVIGTCGAPIHDAGFAVSAETGELLIGKGRYYVDGILCENEEIVPYHHQPDYLPEEGDQAGRYLAYLEAWERQITAVEDPSIREVALGGSDTATRTKTVWQVKLAKLSGPSENLDDECHCPVETRSAGLAARTGPAGPLDPCMVQQGAGYLGLENHLYRVEIHEPGETGTATFKWSRENGSVLRAVEKIENDRITLQNSGIGVAGFFASGQMVEITDEVRELRGQPGVLALLESVEGNVLTVAEGSGLSEADFPLSWGPKVRRWDHRPREEDEGKGGAITTGTDWIDLEYGIQVRFDPDGDYRTFDHWQMAARRATGQIEWPHDENDFVERFGINRHCCPLAVLVRSNESWSVVKDCRRFFPPLTEIEIEGGGAGCAVPVGEGGEYKTLAEAIEDLLDKYKKESSKSICICLLPGEHLVEDLNVQPMTTPSFHLNVRGCGSSTRLVSRGQMRIIGLASIAFENMVIVTRDCNDQELHASGAIFFEGTEKIALRSCWIEGEGAPLIRIGPTARHILLLNNFILPTDVSKRFALIIHQATEDVMVVNNVIRGKFSLGPARVHLGPSSVSVADIGKGSSSFQALTSKRSSGSYSWPDLTSEELALVLDMMKTGRLEFGGPVSGTLRLHGNRLTRILAGDLVVEEIKGLLENENEAGKKETKVTKTSGSTQIKDIDSWVFRQVFASENVVEEENVVLEGQNQIVAKNVSLNSNWFNLARNDSEPTDGKRLGWVIADSAFYTGNSGREEIQICDVSRVSEKAGNTVSIIECQPASYYLAYRPEAGNALLYRWNLEGGRRNVLSERWDKTWTFTPFELNSAPHFLARRPEGEGTAAFALFRWISPGAREKIWSETWECEQDRTTTPIEIDGEAHFVAYRPDDGNVQLWRRNSDGSKMVLGSGWGPGYELLPFNLKGVPHFVAYRSADGSAQVYRWRSDGRRDTVRSEKWYEECVLMPFELGGESYLVMYRPKSVFEEGAGRDHTLKVYRWNADGTREEVSRFNWSKDCLLMPFYLGGVPHVMTYKQVDESFEVHRWKVVTNQKIDREAVGTGKWPLKGYAPTPFELAEKLYFVAYEKDGGRAALCRGDVSGTVIKVALGRFSSLQKSSILIPFKLKGQTHFVVYRPEDGQVILSKGKSEGGVEQMETVWTGTWDSSDSLMLFDLGGKPHYLASRQQTDEILLSRWNPEDGTKELVWSSGWETGYTLFIAPVKICGKSQVIAYMPDDGQVELCRWDAGGFRETVWKTGWDAGHEVLVFFNLDSRPHWLGYRPEDGRVQLRRWDPADGKSEAVWSDEWGRNYVLMPFELDGAPHLALYRPEDGQAQLYRWNPDGSRVPVSREEWGHGYALMPFVLPRD